MDPILLSVIISLVLAAGSLVLSELLRPKPKFENAKPAGLGDFQFPTAEEGRVIPLVWGTVKVAGPNVIWYGDFTQQAITTNIKTGLWSSKRITTGFKYFIGLQMAICRGPIDNVLQIWVGEKVGHNPIDADEPSLVVPGPTSFFIDDSNLFGGEQDAGGISASGQLYMGTASQSNSSYLATFQVPQPGYRGLAYCVVEHGYLGNSTSIAPWAFEVQRLVPGFLPDEAYNIVNKHDMNPAWALLELLNNDDWGLSFPLFQIHVESFDAAAQTLFAEGNGWSFLLDKSMEAADLVQEILRQIDGLIYLDPADGTIHLTLARPDYDLGTVPVINSDNIIEVQEFSRGGWEETSNQIRISYIDRNKNYKTSYAQASDLANQAIQDGQIVAASQTFPGVKNATLAAKIATRQLRYLSIPLAKATVIVDRTLWNIRPGDVVAWTDEELGFAGVPMRVIHADYGTLTDGKITLALLQDIFQFGQVIESAEEPTGWVPITQAVSAFADTQQLAFEAPNALIVRDPVSPTVLDRIFAAGRSSGTAESSFLIHQRNSSGTPSGPFFDAGEVTQFMLIGIVRDAIDEDTANPAVSLTVDPSPDDVSDMVAVFDQSASVSDIGQNLSNLILIDDEFLGVSTAIDSAGYMTLGTVYRGLLDTVPTHHDVGAKVYLIFAGAGLSDSAIDRGNNVDVKLLPKSRDNTVAEGAATTISFTMNDRARRPYPVSELTLNAVRYNPTVDVDTMRDGGTTDDDRGISVTFRRKDYRRLNEVDGTQSDAGNYVADFPTANNYQEQLEVIIDPAGTPISAGLSAWTTGVVIFFSRTDILAANAGVLPTRLQSEVNARHTYDGGVLEALQKHIWAFDVDTSELDNDTNMGVLEQNDVGAPYTAPTTGTYHFSVGPDMSGGVVQARINAGLWVDVVADGDREGDLVGVISGDTIEIRSTQASGSVKTFLRVNAPSSSIDAYAILVV